MLTTIMELFGARKAGFDRSVGLCKICRGSPKLKWVSE